jgi:hypothetical protein
MDPASWPCNGTNSGRCSLIMGECLRSAWNIALARAGVKPFFRRPIVWA